MHKALLLNMCKYNRPFGARKEKKRKEINADSKNHSPHEVKESKPLWYRKTPLPADKKGPVREVLWCQSWCNSRQHTIT
jgi:hypothetical protein